MTDFTLQVAQSMLLRASMTSRDMLLLQR